MTEHASTTARPVCSCASMNSTPGGATEAIGTGSSRCFADAVVGVEYGVAVRRVPASRSAMAGSRAPHTPDDKYADLRVLPRFASYVVHRLPLNFFVAAASCGDVVRGSPRAPAHEQTGGRRREGGVMGISGVVQIPSAVGEREACTHAPGSA